MSRALWGKPIAQLPPRVLLGKPRKRALVVVRYDKSDLSRLAGLRDADFSVGGNNALNANELNYLSNYSYDRAYTQYQYAFANWKLNEAQRQGSGLPSLPMPLAPNLADYQYSNPQVNYFANNDEWAPYTQNTVDFPTATAQPSAPVTVPNPGYVIPGTGPSAADAQAQYDAQRYAEVAALDNSNAQIQAIQERTASANAKAAALRNQVAAALEQARIQEANDLKAAALQKARVAASAAALAVQSAEQQGQQASVLEAARQRQAVADRAYADAEAEYAAVIAKKGKATSNPLATPTNSTYGSTALQIDPTASTVYQNTILDELGSPLGNFLPDAIASHLPNSVGSLPAYVGLAATAGLAYWFFSGKRGRR